MKVSHSIFIAILVLLGVHANAQSNKNVKSSILTYSISASEFDLAKIKLDNYIENNKLFVVKVDASKSYIQYSLNVEPEYLYAIDTLIKKLGYVSSKNLESYQSVSLLDETKLELEYLESKKKEYQLMQVKIDSVKSNRFYEHWQKIREIDEQIFEAKKKIQELSTNSSKSIIKITINDDVSTPNSTRVSFVNMPGIQYNYLMIENPKAGISHQAYQGVMLKYMFTKGKSFFELGAYNAIKNSEQKSDSTAYDELFNFAFGQDFYTKHFGRGSRKFLNLYVGYTGGVLFASNQKKTNTIPYISPSIGVELFKSKNILLDTKASYFLPLKENRFMRGTNLSASFNFVF